MLDPKVKGRIIKKFRTHENDTGSSQIQIAILSHEIDELAEHLKEHKKDFSSRRGLIKKVNERRKLLNYLRGTDYEEYVALSKKLKLKYTAPKLIAEPPQEQETGKGKSTGKSKAKTAAKGTTKKK